MSFWGELKRRNVFKVGAAYVIVAWVILQAISIIFPLLHLPEWTGTFVTVLLIIGFPVALIFAWAFELTADGVKRTSEVAQQESITHVTGRKINYVLGGLLVIAIALLMFDNYYLDRRVVEPEVASIDTEQTPGAFEDEEAPKTIAVLPFDDLSPEKDQEYFVAGLSEEIINSLAQVPELAVSGKTSSFSFKGSNKTVQEISNILGVEHILEGSVRKAGNDLRITAQLLRAEDGFHLFSKTYDRKLEHIFAIQENIAKAVADELKITFGIDKSFKQLGGTKNLEAYELYLVGKGIWRENFENAVSEHYRALESLDAALAIDPEFALAWAVKASYHIFLTIWGPPDSAVAEQEASLSAARKAIEIEPDLVTGYLALGWIKTSKSEFAEAELAFSKALELQTESWPDYVIYPIPDYYILVGYFNKAQEILKEVRQNDPLNDVQRANSVLNYALLGDTKRAEEEYERGKALFGDKWYFGNYLVSVIRLGYKNVASSDIDYASPIFNAVKKHFDSPKDGLDVLHQIYTGSDDISSADFWEISTWAAYFGDPEFAMGAVEKGYKIDATGFFQVWYPVMREVRQLPRFKEFIREIGLVDYWNQFGWPDICHPTDDGDFICD